MGVHACGLGEECVWECMCVVWVRSVCGCSVCGYVGVYVCDLGEECVWFG